MQHRITFPGYMERCCGFTIPTEGVFFAFELDEDLIQFDIHHGTVLEVMTKWYCDPQLRTLTVDNRTIPFLGVWGGEPLLFRPALGTLCLADSCVQLTTPSGDVKSWQFENFSSEWEYVTFDTTSKAFLFGATYDFNFRYVEIDCF